MDNRVLSASEKKRFSELTDENGNFHSNYPGDYVTGLVTIGYLDEFNEFVYLNPNIPISKKAINIKLIETVIVEAIRDKISFNSNFYVHSMWSRLLLSQN